MEGMAGPRRTSGETVPFDRDELARLAKKSVPPAERPNANVVRAKRSTNPQAVAATAVDGEEEVVVVVEMDDEDEPQAPRRARTATLPDPATMSILAEIARAEPAPPVKPAPDDVRPNRHVKRRG